MYQIGMIHSVNQKSLTKDCVNFNLISLGLSKRLSDYQRNKLTHAAELSVSAYLLVKQLLFIVTGEDISISHSSLYKSKHHRNK